jgi:hypothetical protein
LLLDRRTAATIVPLDGGEQREGHSGPMTASIGLLKDIRVSLPYSHIELVPFAKQPIASL